MKQSKSLTIIMFDIIVKVAVKKIQTKFTLRVQLTKIACLKFEKIEDF